MDTDELREATEEWVEEGLVSAEQAAAIREYHDDDDQGSRLAIVVSLMGAALLGVGVIWALASSWEAIPRLVRTAILLLAAPAFAVAGEALVRDRAPRVGNALWTLAVAIVGPALVVLVDLWEIEPGTEWLLVVWAAVALPVGHARRSQLTVALGLAAAAGAVAVLEAATDLPIAVGFLGVALIALAERNGASGVGPDGGGASDDPVRDGAGGRAGRSGAVGSGLGDVYRLVGVALVAATLLAIGGLEWQYDRLALEVTGIVVATALAAVGAVVGSFRLVRAGRLDRATLASVVTGVVAVALVAVLVDLVPPVPAVLAFAVVHLGLLSVLLAAVVVAVERRSRALVNLVAVAFFLQVVAFLAATVADAASGPTVLVVTGLVLLLVALGLERGRRDVLDRMGAT